MSIFGYPADIIHKSAILDEWNRVTDYNSIPKKAKVVEEQKLIKNDKGEDVISIAEIHLEGIQDIKTQDYFLYTNALGKEIRYDIKHIEIKKNIGTDDVKKVIIYG
ncbi:hypothetical protein OEV98_10990 [Caldibacillus lycopersici]|uniref:Uncharacterized protein n=1 Tax=Perspicuibacillus lycopersici TaxID=1325689 RepID=A0AAE3IXZ5_9BACI|nr:hypothetical protein [Perspicuibacillus lycopersici]MCU9614085.1 hypothetical protein [Perspicuibacillus lycopersici]